MRLAIPRLALHATLAVVVFGCADSPTSGRAALRATPAAAVAAADAPLLVITEVMPDPAAVLDDAGEWFEIYNAGDAAVDLGGYVIRSGPSGAETHTIAASVTVPAKGFIVMGRNTDAALNGGAPVAYSYGSTIQLNNSNTDWLTLRTPAGALLDSVAYAVRNNGTPESYRHTAGASRAVIDAGADNTIIAGPNWETSTASFGSGDRGTPGAGDYGDVEPAGEVATVTVAPATVLVGATRPLSATAADSAGRPAQATFTWASATPEVATVDAATGVATGVAEGTTTITATAANGVTGTGTLTVTVPGAVGSVSISMNNPRQAPAGYTKPAFATVRDADGKVVSPPPRLSWSSSDVSVATVDSLGYVTGVAPGAVTITAAAPNGVAGTTPFTVLAGEAPTTAVYRDHVEFGAPEDGDAGDDLLLTKRQFVTSYNAARGGPNWVSWNINASHFGPAGRCDCFSADLTLPADVPRVVDFDYRNGGYDRGHVVQSDSRSTTEQENAATFLLTNILPQAAENNQGPWLRFEIHLNDLAEKESKEIYVVAGGEYAANAPTLKNEGRVAIPSYTWKVAVVLDAGEGLATVRSAADLDVIAVRMPNLTTAGVPASAVGIRNTPWESYTTTVDAIESATGYDLLARLPDAIEGMVESGTRSPVASAGGPYAAAEGSAVRFDGTASADPDGDALTYAWEFGDGATATGNTPSHVYGDDGTYEARLTVTDPFGATSTATAAVTITNVAPAVGPFDGAMLLPGETYAAEGSFADPGADRWTATMDYGDGPGAQPLALSGRTFRLSHAYDRAGTYTVAVAVADDDGGSGTRAATVVVQTPQSAVQAVSSSVASLVAAGTISRGNGNALDAKLNVAIGQLDAGNATAARNQLEAFVNQVEAMQRSGRLPATDASRLIAGARRIIAAI
jgi:DNA/RNA endonuclease G (NUC1)